MKTRKRQADQAAPQPSAFEMYRKLSTGFPVTLPSGITVMLRRIALADFIKRGELPAYLQNIVTRTAQVLNNVDNVEVTPAEIKQFKEWVVTAAVQNLSITLDEDGQNDQTLHISEIPEADKEAIYEYAFANIHKAVETFSPFLPPATPNSLTPSPNDTDSAPPPSSV